VAGVQPPGKMPGRACGVVSDRRSRPALRSLPGGPRAGGPGGRRRWAWRLLGVCSIAAVVSWLSTLASASTEGPLPPTGLYVTAVGSSQVSLSWTAPDALPSQYDIYAGTTSGGESPVPVGTSDVTSDTVTGLASGTTYYFDVTAVYCFEGCSDSAPSGEVSATTSFSVPGAPTGLAATATGSSRVHLNWAAPAPTAGAPVTGYEVYDGTSSGAESLAGRSSATSDTVTGLSSGTTYYFEVTAFNSAGESALSNQASATTDRAVQNRTSQVIQFGPLARHVAGVRFTVVASASSGLPVSFASGTPGVCSVSGSQVTAIKPGRCTITASQGGNTDYAPAPDQTRSFRVDRARGRLRPQAITFARPADVPARRLVRLSASASSGLPVSFASDSPGVCSVSGSQVTTIKPGRCTITASQGGNAHYAPAPDQTRSFQVSTIRPWALRALAFVLAAMALMAAAAALLIRAHRLRTRRPARQSVRAEPHLGPPGMVHLRVTGTDVTSTVRIEPHPAEVSSHLERAQP
jgi:Fibronectin type III domain